MNLSRTCHAGMKRCWASAGASLSGGQRQRLAIARAIVTNPRVLILDDATASVDPETEDLIRRGMRFVMHGRTTFVIAHRVSTVKAGGSGGGAGERRMSRSPARTNN